VAEKAKKFNEMGETFYVTYAISMALFIGVLGMIFLSLFLWTLHRCIEISYSLVAHLIEIGLYIALIILYAVILENF